MLGFEHLGVEAAELHADVLFLLGEIPAHAHPLLLSAAQLVDLAPGEVQADGVELGDEPVVAAGGVGLAFQRSQLAPHLAQEIREPEQVALGRFEAALRLLLALAELEDAGRLFDDRPAILRARIQHGVELTLADDHVLLTADAGVGEEILDVEQPAGNTVHHVLGLTGAEEHPRDRHLGELDRQQPCAVVDRERHLGPAQRRPVGGAGEDDVVHLRAAQRACALCAEHPRHGVDDVRLARSVRADDNANPRLELERGLVGEGLEALQGQRLQEQLGPLSGR